MKRFSPQHLTDWYFAEIEDQLRVIFDQEVMDHVVKIIKAATAQPVQIENASGEDVLRRALRNGQIQYAGGIFSGKFTAAISKALKGIGSIFYPRQGVFKIEPTKVPSVLIAEAAAYHQRASQAHDAIQGQLDKTLADIDKNVYGINSERMVEKVDAGWRRSAAALMVKPELTKEGKRNLAANYSENMNLWIKKWLKEQILGLRQDVQENAEAGYRFDSLIEKVQRRKSVSETKAKFLARQETGLFMSQYRAQRFIDAGLLKYKWSTSHDARVRPAKGLRGSALMHAGNHRILDGQVFTYAGKAPARYMSVGQPCNPGEDYQCRCGDIPQP